MSGSFTQEEFYEYVKNLKFLEPEDLIAFINSYYEYYLNTNSEDRQQLIENYMRYSAVISIHGPMLLQYIRFLEENVK